VIIALDGFPLASEVRTALNREIRNLLYSAVFENYKMSNQFRLLDTHNTMQNIAKHMENVYMV